MLARCDLSSILVAGRVLTDADVSALSAYLEPPWRARQRRLNARDAAIRKALAGFSEMGTTSAARELATRLRRYLATAAWASDQHEPCPANPAHELLHRIALANEGGALGWRQIMRVAAGERAGVS